MLKRINLETILVTTTENGTERIVTDATGSCLRQGSAMMLRYAEKLNEGNATLILSDDLADLRRNGLTTSRMTFIKGQLLPCPYSTPQGNIDIQIFTHEQTFEMGESGGEFHAKYSLLFSGQSTSDNELTIRWNFF